MIKIHKYLGLIIIVLLLILTAASSLPAQDKHELEKENEFSTEEGENELMQKMLLSGRIEIINYTNKTESIRVHTGDRNRLYFNNIYLNMEGFLHPKIDYIVEIQLLTSDLYRLGGFLSIAESLEGIGDDAEPGSKKEKVVELVTDHLSEIDDASGKPSLERARIDFIFNEAFGIKVGNVRNPFGFWDDYSLFRNLSAGKTDPISLGVALRRTDLGIMFHGNLAGKYLNYKLGVLDGENILYNRDTNDYKDIVAQLGTSLGRIDLGLNFYAHDVGSGNDLPYGFGLQYRYRATDWFTLLGEFIYIRNNLYDITTYSGYIQGNYDLSDYLIDGLRWNLFLEAYHSDLLKVDLDYDNSYYDKFRGTVFQSSTGFIYALSRNIDLGAQIIIGIEEEGDPIYKGALKIDARF